MNYKSKKSVSFILCDHGMGHSRRGLTIALELQALAKDLSLTLLADPQKVARLCEVHNIDLKNHPQIQIMPFKTTTSAASLRQNAASASDWEKRLPAAALSADLVVSDNLPEILKVRKDAVLTGSFFWHEDLTDFPRQRYQELDLLLQENRPTLLGTGLLVSEYLRSRSNFRDVGFFAFSHERLLPVQGAADLLLSIGLSDECLTAAREAVQLLMDSTDLPFDTLWIEPRLLPKNARKNMQPASFSRQMYNRLAAAVIRPGVGTLTECLQAGAHIFCFHESGNQEMRRNAMNLQRESLGLSCDSAVHAVQEAIRHCRQASGDTRARRSELKMDGARQAAEILKEILDA